MCTLHFLVYLYRFCVSSLCCLRARHAAEKFNKAVLELDEKAENLVPTPVRVPWQIKYHLLMLPDDGGKAGTRACAHQTLACACECAPHTQTPAHTFRLRARVP